MGLNGRRSSPPRVAVWWGRHVGARVSAGARGAGKETFGLAGRFGFRTKDEEEIGGLVTEGNAAVNAHDVTLYLPLVD